MNYFATFTSFIGVLLFMNSLYNCILNTTKDVKMSKVSTTLEEFIIYFRRIRHTHTGKSCAIGAV